MSATITAFPGSFETSRRSAEPRRGEQSRADERRSALAADVRATRERNGFGTLPVRSRLHLTRRGRVAVTILVVLPILAAVGAAMLNGGGADATPSSGDVHFQHVMIEPGETLWQVAGQVAPNSDPRDVVDDIVRLNNLESSSVMAGQSIAIPVQYSSH